MTPLDPINRAHFVSTLVWLAATAPVWFVGAFASTDVRFTVWAAAAVIDVIGVWLAHPLLRRRLHSGRPEFGGEHMMERCRLFLLIAFGETVATPGAALATPGSVQKRSRAAYSLWKARSLSWWLYFHAEPIALLCLANAQDRVHAGRMGTNELLFMIPGLIGGGQRARH